MTSTTVRLALLATTALASPAYAQDVIELGEIVIRGSSYETEGTDSYTTDLVSVGEKSAMSQREVPQSTTVITREQIEDGNYTALETAITDSPGLLVLNNDTGRSSLFSRGFEFDYLYFDGLPASVSSIYGTQPDLSIVDHVEVLKGPSGLFIGTGEPAGSINMRLKQAPNRLGGYVRSSVSSDGHGRLEGDVGGPLNKSGTLRGRAVLAYGDGEGFVDKQESGVVVGYGTLAWDVTPDTTLTFSASRMQRDIAPYNGLPTYEDGSFLYLDPGATTAADWNDFQNAVTDYVFAAEHRVGNGGRLKFSARRSDQKADFLYAYGGSPANVNNEIDGLAYLGRDFDQQAWALDAHAELPLSFRGLSGTLIVGADWQQVEATTLTARGSIDGTFDLNDWDVSGAPEPTPVYSSQTTSDYTATGLYSQLRLKPTDRLTVIGGARLTWYDSTSENLVNGDISNVSENAHLTPFAGTTWDVTDSTTLYASYSEIFQPNSEIDANGNVLAPIEGQQTEVGVKAELGFGLNASAALFDLRQINRPVAIAGENYFAADEEVRAKGLELELAGELSPGWQVAAGYTYTDTEIVEGPSEGEVFSSVTPEHIFKLSTEYTMQDGALKNWSFGGRFRVVSEFSSRGVVAPGYGVVDLTASKDIMGSKLRIGVENVFDEEYYTRVGSTQVFNFRGAPRTFTASLTRRF